VRKAVMILLACSPSGSSPEHSAPGRALELITLLSRSPPPPRTPPRPPPPPPAPHRSKPASATSSRASSPTSRAAASSGRSPRGTSAPVITCATLTTSGNIRRAATWASTAGMSSGRRRRHHHVAGLVPVLPAQTRPPVRPADRRQQRQHLGHRERGYINNCVNWINNIDGDLQNKGWMN